MQNSQDRIKHLQGKLRLKRNNSSSSPPRLSSNVKCISESCIKVKDTSSNDKLSCAENTTSSVNSEDSLADFKSPKEEKVYKPILNKFKIDAEKVKKKILKSKNKPNIKSGRSSYGSSQPSIESSFFKPQTSNQNEIRESVPCPLCLKPFKDDFTCTNHMKTCATKNNVSIKQLLNAKQLQDRQAEERKAMGLLAAPVLPERKKVYRTKNYSTGNDPQLQLVLAMSESLYEAEQIVELEQAALLAGIPSECIKEMNDGDRRTTLQKFGFTTNKPASDVLNNKSRKRKLLGPTILQTRSKEDKDRVLTERIACILTGDDAFTQAQQISEVSQKSSPTVLRSRILKKIQQSTDKLWDKSRLTKIYDFYVKELKPHFIQSDENLKKSEFLNSSFLSDNLNNDDEQNILSNSSVVYEPMDIDMMINQSCERKSFSSLDMNETESMNCESDFMKNLVLCWGETLNNSAASDIIIIVKNNEHIYTHKLVFFVQRPSILNHVELNDSEKFPNIKEKICWFETDQLAALAFLEFIYCGMISKNKDIFGHNDLLTQVKKLARLYKVNELITYVRIKQNELMKLKECNTTNEDIIDTDPYSVKDLAIKCSTSYVKKNSSCVQQLTHIRNSTENFKSNFVYMDDRLVTRNDSNNIFMKNDTNRQNTVSPDLFEVSGDLTEIIYSPKTQQNNLSKENQNNSNLNKSIDLINNSSVTSQNVQTSQSEENYETETTSSQKTVVDLRRTPSLEINKSIIYSHEEDIYEALTPKSRSPERDNNATLEKMDHDFQNIAGAVTTQSSSPEKHAEIILQKLNNSYDQISESIISKNQSPESYFDTNMKRKVKDNAEIAEAVTPKNRSPERCNDEISDEMNDLDSQMATVITSEYNTPKKTVNVLCQLSVSNDTFQKDEDSIYNAVTPPRSDENQFELNKIIQKPKTDLSLFIDKIHKQNAKGALDSDSEIDSPMPPIKHRNPFLKKNRDESYAYLRGDGFKQEERRVISLLENDVREAEKKSDLNCKGGKLLLNISDKYNESTSINLGSELHNECTELDNSKLIDSNASLSKTKSQTFAVPSNVTVRTYVNNNSKKTIDISTSDDEIDNITVNESEMSMYSKYTKFHKHDNSIEKYRNQLNINQKKTDIELDEKTNLNDDSSNIKKKILLQSHSISKPETVIDITLVSDSDNEEQSNLKTTTKFKQGCNHNSTELERKDTESKLLSETSLSNIENNSTISLHINHQSQASIEKSNLSINEPKNKVIDLSLDSDEENIYNDSTFLYNLAVETDNSLENEKNVNKEIYTSRNKQTELLKISEKKNDEVDAEISKILQSSPELIDGVRNFIQKSDNESSQQVKLNQEKNKTSIKKNYCSQPEVINLSPISIISSPEDNSPKSESKSLRKEKSKDNISNKEEQFEFNSNENECFNCDWNPKSPLKKDRVHNLNKSFEPILGDNNISKRKLNFENASSKNGSTPSEVSENLRISLTSPPIINPNNKKSNPRSKKRRSQSPEQTRKLKKKSVSASNFSDFQKSRESVQRSISSVTPEKYTKTSLKSNHKEDVTPPVDYSVLETPELKKHLSKYGIKPQSRSKAKLLLRHIYNEIHPVVSTSQKRASSTNNSSSEDEQPPLKRQDVKETILKEKNEPRKARNSQNSQIIAEEMVYDEPEVANDLENPVSIKDAFFRLIKTNKELYTKVLTLEPLSLDCLHLMLKKTGFKCKINTLMDFLDEQCITFQMQTGKNSRTKKKNK